MAHGERPEGQERRSHPRRKSRINQLVHAAVREENQEYLTSLYLVDLSLGGMRANTDRALEPESTLTIDLPVDPYLGEELSLLLTCRVVWRRPIPGGTYVHGFQFLSPTTEQQELITRLFAAFVPEGMRERYRLNQTLNIAYQKDGKWVPRYAFDISPEGLGIQMRESLPRDEVIHFLVYLEDEDRLDATSVKGKVSYISEPKDGFFRMGVKFVDLEDHVARRIRAYIDRRR